MPADCHARLLLLPFAEPPPTACFCSLCPWPCPSPHGDTTSPATERRCDSKPALPSPLLVPADSPARLFLLPVAEPPPTACFLHAALPLLPPHGGHPQQHDRRPPAPAEHMEGHAVGAGNRSMRSGHLEDAKLTHLVDLTIADPRPQLVSTLSTFFALVKQDGLREPVEFSINQLKR